MARVDTYGPFVRGKTYCELCLEEVDPMGLSYNDGYTNCCNELTVDANGARRIAKEYMEEDAGT